MLISIAKSKESLKSFNENKSTERTELKVYIYK